MTAPLPPQNTIKPVNPLNKTASNARLAITVSIVAIVFATTGFLLGAINYNAITTSAQDIKTALQNNFKTQTITSTLTHDAQAHAKELDMLQQDLQKLENSQNIPLQKTLAEVSYLIHLANLHLTIGHDKETALSLLNMAKQYLAPVQNNAFLPLKQALNNDTEALKKSSAVNITDTYTKLNKISDEINQLNPLPTHNITSIHDTVSNIKKAAQTKTHWYDRLWESVKELKHLFIIHEIQNPSAPITAPDKLFYLKQNIQTKLAQAQWALLHNNNTIYNQSLSTVTSWLKQYFSMSDSTEPVVKELNKISTINISNDLPDIKNSLSALSKIKLSPPDEKTTNTSKADDVKNLKKAPKTKKQTLPNDSTHSVEI